MPQEIDIVIPVYRGYKELKVCIDSVVKYNQLTPFNIIIINDASPEEKLNKYLEELLRIDKRILYLKNEINLGYIESVNRGISVSKNDVILLNSDTEVANDWIDRLVKCAYSEDKIGTISPFSNNATICSFPKFCVSNELPLGWTIEKIDEIFSRINKGKYIELPTTVGFCMYIKRECIKKIGLFDAKKFGIGYGEENDFCMRAAKGGWKHVLCADAFVYHKGGISFGNEQENRKRLAISIMEHIHPDYLNIVYRYVKNDPARIIRITAMVEMFRESHKKKILFVSHHIGGGCEKHIKELANYLKQDIEVAVIRSSEAKGVTLNIDIERSDDCLFFSIPKDYKELINFCNYLKISRVHFHHILGLDNIFLNLSNDLSLPLDITLHDYYFINSNPTLTDKNGKFCENIQDRDKLCLALYPIPHGLTAYEWREKNAKFLNLAKRVFSPSEYTLNLYKQYFPKANYIVAYHPDWEKNFPYPSPKNINIKNNETLNILAIGALNKEKGADVLEACAKIAKNNNYPIKFYLLGYAYRSLSAVNQYGMYEDDKIDYLILKLNPHIIWFPVQLPETYSYTLSAALRTGIPAVVPDIGSFPERVLLRPYTWVEKWKKRNEEWVEFFLDIRKNFFNNINNAPNSKWESQSINRKKFLYRTNYVTDDSYEEINNIYNAFIPDNNWYNKFVNRININLMLSKKEKLLFYLLKLRLNPFIARCLNIMPYGMQRLIKRWFSRKPIHEIMNYDKK